MVCGLQSEGHGMPCPYMEVAIFMVSGMLMLVGVVLYGWRISLVKTLVKTYLR